MSSPILWLKGSSAAGGAATAQGLTVTPRPLLGSSGDTVQLSVALRPTAGLLMTPKPLSGTAGDTVQLTTKG